MQEEVLIQKLRDLPPERLAEVEDFIDFVAQRNAIAARHAAIAAYAGEHHGTLADLDPELEAASIECWSDEGLNP